MLLVWCFGWAPYAYAKKVLGKHAAMGEPVQVRFESSGIDWQGPDSSSHLQWTAIAHLDETRSLFLLYVGPVAAIRIPKRFFLDEQQHAAWRTLVQESIASKKIRRPSWIGRLL